MINEIAEQTKSRMAKSIDSLRNELTKLRTGRANTSLLDQIMVPYYGTDTPLNQVASVAVSDSRTLLVTPWEKTMVQPVEKAILNADLGLNPSTSGDAIRVPLPPLTEERRRELTKVVRSEAEGARVAIRNIRRDANSSIKDLLKAKDISEDEERKAQEKVQKITDQFIKEVDELASTKEADLMEV